MDPELVSAGVQAVGGLFKGIGSFVASRQQAAGYRAAAAQALQESGVQSTLALDQGQRQAAHAAVGIAANGGGFGGSSLAVLDDLSSQALYNARQAVYGGVTEASQDQYRARVAKAQGNLGLVGSLFGEAGSLAAGAMKSGYTRSFQGSRDRAAGYGVSIPDYGA